MSNNMSNNMANNKRTNQAMSNQNKRAKVSNEQVELSNQQQDARNIMIIDDTDNKQFNYTNILCSVDLLMLISMYLEVLEEVRTLLLLNTQFYKTIRTVIGKIYRSVNLSADHTPNEQQVENCCKLFGQVTSLCMSIDISNYVPIVQSEPLFFNLASPVQQWTEVGKTILSVEQTLGLNTRFKQLTELRFLFNAEQFTWNMAVYLYWFLACVNDIMQTTKSIDLLEWKDARVCGLCSYPDRPIWSSLQYLLLGCYDLNKATSHVQGVDKLLTQCPNLISLQYVLVGRPDTVSSFVNDLDTTLHGVDVSKCPNLTYLSSISCPTNSINSVFNLPTNLKTLFYSMSIGNIIIDYTHRFNRPPVLLQQGQLSDQLAVVKPYEHVKFLHLSLLDSMENDVGTRFEPDLMLHLVLFPNIEYLTLRFDVNAPLFEGYVPNFMQGYLFNLEDDDLSIVHDGPYGDMFLGLCSTLAQESCRPNKLKHLRLILDLSCYSMDSWQRLLELVNGQLVNLESLTIEIQLVTSYFEILRPHASVFAGLDMSVDAQIQRHVNLEITEAERFFSPSRTNYQKGLQYLKQNVRKSLQLYILFHVLDDKQLHATEQEEEKDDMDDELNIEHATQIFYLDGFQDVFQEYLEREHPRETTIPVSKRVNQPVLSI